MKPSCIVKERQDERFASQGLVSVQNSFLVEQSMITLPNSEELNNTNLSQQREVYEATAESRGDEVKSGTSPSGAKTTKTLSSKMEAFFALDTTKKEDSDATSGRQAGSPTSTVAQ